jgi:hypothetical protein
MGLLGRILIGIAATAIGAVAVAITVKHINGVIDKKRLKNLAMEDNLKNAIVEEIDYCNNIVNVKSLLSNKEVAYQSNSGIESDVIEGMQI